MKGSASSPLTAGKADFEKSNSRIPKTLVPFSVTFISISLTATSPFPSEGIPRDARWRHESSRSVFDQFLDELDLAPTRYNFAPGETELSVRFANSRVNFF